MIEFPGRVSSTFLAVDIFERCRDFVAGIGEAHREDGEVVTRARGGEGVEHDVVLSFLDDISLGEEAENLALEKLENPAVWSNYVDNSDSRVGKPAKRERESVCRVDIRCAHLLSSLPFVRTVRNHV
ncbi:hypothetical protein BMI90_17700 [Thioclava sp. L04-15]|uniref:hypothetical protein n=1 Tax=Thioclava sp. L04-15 TaxID=1915318 RepID=UPI0009977D99|nr:hypothetical protein [Thioclava sp. L04-15]OOY26438.1 hypothetical protein BMI90_17700 [Thioclava sp. L04-15]TNE82842.1 MAG: hypothetical protein EP337_18075 [Paracoccaceae bacterium]